MAISGKKIGKLPGGLEEGVEPIMPHDPARMRRKSHLVVARGVGAIHLAAVVEAAVQNDGRGLREAVAADVPAK